MKRKRDLSYDEEVNNLPDREMRDLYVTKETLKCSLNHCVPCSYKIILHPGTYKNCVPNERPENCLRVSKKSKGGMDEHRKQIGIYRDTDYILTVGDGDFSFTLSLARGFCQKIRQNQRLIATSHESRKTILQAYPHVKPVLEELNARGVTVLHEVDGTNLEGCSELVNKKFHRIIWNFPCKGRGIGPGQDGQNQEMEENKELVRQFCKSAETFLVPFGEVHITHKTKPPYSHWGIEHLGTETSRLVFKGSVIFDRSSYQPYTNRKALDRKSFPIFDSETFVFSKPIILAGNVPGLLSVQEPTLPTIGCSGRSTGVNQKSNTGGQGGYCEDICRNDEAGQEILQIQKVDVGGKEIESRHSEKSQLFSRNNFLEPVTEELLGAVRQNLVRLDSVKKPGKKIKRTCLRCSTTGNTMKDKVQNKKVARERS